MVKSQNIIEHEKITINFFFFFEVDKEFPTNNFIELILNIYVSLLKNSTVDGNIAIYCMKDPHFPQQNMFSSGLLLN